MSQAVQTYDGWYVYHDFRKIDWKKWKSLDASKREQIIQELQETIQEFSAVENDRQGSFGLYAISGHKADLLFVHLRPTIDELNEVKWKFSKTEFADVTTDPTSYTSVVELSSYTVPPGTDPYSDPSIQERLKPILPKTSHVCFYPMNKRRSGEDNWYMLSVDERRRMMRSHGMIGRSYAGKVRQIISGSIGFDDWEWGVTLFSNDPLNFKKLVTKSYY